MTSPTVTTADTAPAAPRDTVDPQAAGASDPGEPRDAAAMDEEIEVSVFDREDVTFDVVRNLEEQYSIWPDGWQLPGGWERVGFRGLRAACLAHIEEVWVDMRPASVRRWMEARENEA